MEARADLNALDEEGNLPLHLAAMSGKAPSIKLLLDARADPTKLARQLWIVQLAWASMGARAEAMHHL